MSDASNPFSDDDVRYMRMALQEAERAAELDEVPVGAVIVANGQVIARAHNLCERLRDFTAHAEMQAFTSASEFLEASSWTSARCTSRSSLVPCAQGRLLDEDWTGGVWGQRRQTRPLQI